jgi:ubiquinone/menaquinone biosynthesis C-methylase UbiE
LDIARRQVGEELIHEIAEADVRDLSHWPANRFDTTIALGPFYHLTSPLDRRQALEEIMRVTAPGGTVAIALMPKYALLRRTLAISDERHRMADASFLDAVISDGSYYNPSLLGTAGHLLYVGTNRT